MDAKTPKHIASSGNVFADLGLPNAEELQAKAALANQVVGIVASKHIGSGFDDFLRDEDLLTDAEATAAKRVIAFQTAGPTEGEDFFQLELGCREETCDEWSGEAPEDPAQDTVAAP